MSAVLPRPVPGFYTPTKFYRPGEAPNAPRKRARRDNAVYGPPIPFNLDPVEENEQASSASQSETIDE